jgi:hypothetical protein
MADSIDPNANQQLPTYSLLKAHEQLAIALRSEGQPYKAVVAQIEVDYNLVYKEQGIREWFMAGGRLEQANNEYLEFLADESVKQAKLHIKRLSTKASDVLEKLMDDKDTADNIKERAARTVLNKYIPDRQIIVDENKKDDLPGAIAAAAEGVLNDTPTAEPANPPENTSPEGNEDAAAEPANPPEN